MGAIVAVLARALSGRTKSTKQDVCPLNCFYFQSIFSINGAVREALQLEMKRVSLGTSRDQMVKSRTSHAGTSAMTLVSASGPPSILIGRAIKTEPRPPGT